EMEVRDLLTEYDYPGDDTPVIAGSALKALEGDEEYEAKIIELMDTIDEYIPLPERDDSKPFLMPVEDVFSISGRGTVATGRVEQGKVSVGDDDEAGDISGPVLRGRSRDDSERRQVLAQPGSINPHSKCKGQVYVLSKEEGRRHTPFFTNYRPQFYFRTTDVTGVVELPEGTE